MAEPGTDYCADAPLAAWVEVLVDCPGAQGIFTYRLPPSLVVQPGDILSVPFGMQQVGAIAIRCLATPPADLEPTQIKDVDTLLQTGFFSATYWQLLTRVADYYCTSLMQVVRVALPPGLLTRSQRRVRLVDRKANSEIDASPPPSALRPLPSALSPAAQQLLTLLKASKTGDYTWQYLQRQCRGAHQGLQELIRNGWVENYLEPPAPVRPKQRLAVTLVASPSPADLT
ncbi:MAG TPA: primosomal protein N', partial [Crinalium sp.]